jgi:acetyl-CoA carboxylase biotin carboxyl carrier protein
VDTKELRELIDLVSRSNVSTFELEREGFRLRLVKHEGHSPLHQQAVAHVGVPVAATPVQPSSVAAASGGAGAETEPGPASVDEGLVEMTSPIVGTFYRSPSPGAPPFVEVGTRIRKGQVLCIIEAMKLMNEIEAEIDAEVIEVSVENGQPVEFGEVLFRLRPSA